MATSATALAHSDARFRRTVDRITAEAYWLHNYQSAVEGMRGVHAEGLDFFRLALNALKDARLIRLIRVLEDDSQTASFWYLLQSNERLVKKAAKQAKLNLLELRRVADALVPVRNKTFVHIDRAGVFDPQKYYRDAGLNNDQVGQLIVAFYKAMRLLRREVFGQDIEADEYLGTDIRHLAALRDQAAA